eukprot:TRINITY_DN13292_c0_g2_i1.p1 TRINITY_DN13292_c0_g2~~TRINITY_DN13292_c0_g2_i1.p1  ORF type:complete len:750 (-),score=90.13 TRINITY_DN13292_c0_g2_i1:282-2483(-)
MAIKHKATMHAEGEQEEDVVEGSSLFLDFVYGKFSLRVASRSVAEWKEYYCSCAGLRKLIHDKLPRFEDGSMSEDDAMKFQEDVVNIITAEAKKADAFYTKKRAELAEAVGEVPRLGTPLHEVVSNLGLGSSSEEDSATDSGDEQFINVERHRDMHDDLRRHYSFLSREGSLLKEFCLLNRGDLEMAVMVCARLPAMVQLKAWLSSLHFWEQVGLEPLALAVKRSFANVLTAGSLELAEAQLIVDPTKHVIPALQRSAARSRRTGVIWGMAIAACAWTVWTIILLDRERDVPFDDECLMSFEVEIDWPRNATDYNAQVQKEVLKRAFDYYVPIYRAAMALSLWYSCWGLLRMLWKNKGMNYFSIFGLDPLRSTHATIVLRRAAVLVVIVCGCMLTSLQGVFCQNRLPLTPWMIGSVPLIMCVAMVTTAMYWTKGRLLILLVVAVWSPFSSTGVQTLDAYIGDVLTSLIKPIHEAAYSTCFFVTGEFMLPLGAQGACRAYWYSKIRNWPSVVLLLFPNVLRICQNLRILVKTRKRHPHLTNTCKYVAGLLVSLFGLVHQRPVAHHWFYYCWLVCFVGSTLYAFLWDVFMDWVLVAASRSCLCIPLTSCRLRKKRLFDDTWLYGFATIADFFLRFFGTYTLLPKASVLFNDKWAAGLSFWAEILEVLRRSLWSVFKMEWMQISYVVAQFQPGGLPEPSSKSERTWMIVEVVGFVTLVLMLAFSVAKMEVPSGHLI